ncbi:MAG: tRNA (guanosine(46)-N7)-methyltransferase TrmB [Pseudomonadales bacterium]|nr:tRNA (guanosine(46)-N7)-methyltransferase TrmB [Pseudomonadales bacterium]
MPIKLENKFENNSAAQPASNKQEHRRQVRSFVIREGRITPGQKRALLKYWPEYGLDVAADGLISVDSVFDKQQPTVLEIGFGMGDSLYEMASGNLKTNFIGVEVHRPGIGHLMQLAAAANLKNLKLYRADSIDVLEQSLPVACLDKVQIFFPDPWHKKKHHKRRLITQPFIDLLRSRLKPDGILHVATDWAEYAAEIKALMQAETHAWDLSETPLRPTTKYEKRGIRLGHEVFDLAFKKRC